MLPIKFEGSSTVNKPKDMTDEQCMSIWAKHGFIDLTTAMERFEAKVPPQHYMNVDEDGYHFWLTAWKPSYEDLQALNRGEPFFIKTLSNGLPPMAVFTLDENNELN